MRLYTNNNAKHDSFGLRLQQVCKNTNLKISAAFFSNSQFILKVIENGCSDIYLIVRLDFGTSSDDLKKIMDNDRVHIRFYNSKRFHPKLYIVEGLGAFVGSSNLTGSGLTSNLEINVEIDDEDPVYNDLVDEFDWEWDNAQPLTHETLNIFTFHYNEKYSSQVELSRLIQNAIGEIAPQNITILDKPSSSAVKIDAFRKKYDIFIQKYNRLKTMYMEVSPNRKYDSSCPLRLETDGFLSYLRDTHAGGDGFSLKPVLQDEQILRNIAPLKEAFLAYNESDYYNNLPAQRAIPGFSSVDTIISLDGEGIYESLFNHVWSFNNQLHHISGGASALKEAFISNNTLTKMRETIIHLLYGKGDWVKRIHACIYDPQYKLVRFAVNCVEELFGLLNQEDIPIRNERVLKMMQWLGFGHL